MTWNYRVLREECADMDFFKIIEVYYGDGLSWCDASIDGWNSPDELKGTLEKMLEAFDKPVLEDFGCSLQEASDD